MIVNQDNIIIDGKHRACWLLNKYGKHKKVKVLKIYMQSQQPSTNKNFVCSANTRFMRHIKNLDEYSFVSFDYEQSQDDVFQIYYTQSGDEGFSENKSIIIKAPKTKNKTGSISVGLYADKLFSLRIDAGMPGNIINISNVVITNQNQKKELNIKKFITTNMDVLEKTKNHIIFKPISDDPQLIYKLQ